MGVEMFQLHGRTAWIPGGAKGLGLQMAHALAGCGADIAINSRHREEAEAAAREIAAKHRVRAIAGGADVTRPEEVQAFVDRIVSELGGVDILVNSAGINVRLPTL